METIVATPIPPSSPVNDAIRSIESRFLISSKGNLDLKKTSTKSSGASNRNDVPDEFIRIDLDNLSEATDTEKSNEVGKKAFNSMSSEDSPPENCLSYDINRREVSGTIETSSKKSRPHSAGRYIPPNRSQRPPLTSLSTSVTASPWQFKALPMPIFAEIHKKKSLCHRNEFKPTKTQSFKFESDVRVLKRQEYDRVVALRMSQLEGQRTLEGIQKAVDISAKIKAMRRRTVEDGGMSFKAAPILLVDTYPAVPVKSAPITRPKSPRLSVTKNRPRSMTYTSNN